jgi:hypothetical protein
MVLSNNISVTFMKTVDFQYWIMSICEVCTYVQLPEKLKLRINIYAYEIKKAASSTIRPRAA